MIECDSNRRSTFRPSDDNRPSILAFGLFLLFQTTYQRWLYSLWTFENTVQ